MPQARGSGNPDESAGRLALTIAASIVCRTALNTARRFIYPFAPDLSRTLGVPLTSITALIAVNWATNLLGMVAGPLADRFGYRGMMLIGMVMLAAGMMAGGLFPYFGVLIVAQFLSGLGKSLFDPALQAYVGARVPYRRRGLVVGFLETAWAASTLVGIPAMAFLIDRAGWRTAFFALGVCGIGGLLMLRAATPVESRAASTAHAGLDFRGSLREVLENRPALGLAGFAFLFNLGMDNLFVVYGVWLEEAFQLSLLAVGVGTSVIGAAELAGEFLTAGLADRVGLKRAAVGGVAFCVLTYAGLPFAATTAHLALAMLFVHFCIFEMTVVTILSLATELLPRSRATMVATYYAAAGLGRVGGAILGGAVWPAFGIVGTGVTSAAITAFSLASLLWGLRGWHKD
jgi:MFS transporter, DHA1 family, inner membrane transport protein